MAQKVQVFFQKEASAGRWARNRVFPLEISSKRVFRGVARQAGRQAGRQPARQPASQAGRQAGRQPASKPPPARDGPPRAAQSRLPLR